MPRKSYENQKYSNERKLNPVQDYLSGKGSLRQICRKYGVPEFVETRHQDLGVEVNGHKFIRMDGFEEKSLGFAACNKAAASWWCDWHNEVPMTEDEADAILGKYPRIDQGMIPITELLQ